MTPTATATRGAGRTTPACPRSPRLPAPNGSYWPATPATDDSATPCCSRPTRRCESHPARGPTTTSTALGARPTTKPSAPWRTGSSASSTAACVVAPATTNTAPGTPPTIEPQQPDPNLTSRDSSCPAHLAGAQPRSTPD